MLVAMQLCATNVICRGRHARLRAKEGGCIRSAERTQAKSKQPRREPPRDPARPCSDGCSGVSPDRRTDPCCEFYVWQRLRSHTGTGPAWHLPECLGVFQTGIGFFRPNKQFMNLGLLIADNEACGKSALAILLRSRPSPGTSTNIRE